ncbi:MAG TPA: DoxX family membrane protein [Acidimicrobiales bacterium]|nr:DoxX family membrane protein [Acidimicrobiales bacterium]
MTRLHAAARLALAWVFIRAGYDVVRRPEKPASTARPFLAAIRSSSPAPVPDDVAVVRANAAVQIVAGAILTTGRVPRVAAGLLVASLVPTTLAGHAFWNVEEPLQRANQRNHFNKNLGLIGGLLLMIATGKRRVV